MFPVSEIDKPLGPVYTSYKFYCGGGIMNSIARKQVVGKFERNISLGPNVTKSHAEPPGLRESKYVQT